MPIFMSLIRMDFSFGRLKYLKCVSFLDINWSFIEQARNAAPMHFLSLCAVPNGASFAKGIAVPEVIAEQVL
jgi:hypothetical protein